MTTEKMLRDNVLLGATSTKRRGMIMHGLHWKAMTWSLGISAAWSFAVFIVWLAPSAASA